jgi:7-cyano-7-deazaguanine reductase
MTSGELTVLGQRVEPGAARLESIDVDAAVTVVTFDGDELVAVCPVTGQPDFYAWEVSFAPAGRSIESKSLKLYLWSWRDRGIFAEALAARIAVELTELVGAPVTVRLVQHVRGGITTTVIAEGEQP